jgi:hypothetical protein
MQSRQRIDQALLIATIACKHDAPRLSTKCSAPWGTTAPKRRWLRWAAANGCDPVRDDMARTKPRREGVGKAEPHVVRRLFTSVGLRPQAMQCGIVGLDDDKPIEANITSGLVLYTVQRSRRDAECTIPASNLTHPGEQRTRQEYI